MALQMMNVTKFVSQKKIGKKQGFAQLQAAKEIALAWRKCRSRRLWQLVRCCESCTACTCVRLRGGVGGVLPNYRVTTTQ